MKYRHKWKKVKDGKECIKCGARINTAIGCYKYIELSWVGKLEPVDYYPRCVNEDGNYEG